MQHKFPLFYFRHQLSSFNSYCKIVEIKNVRLLVLYIFYLKFFLVIFDIENIIGQKLKYNIKPP